MKKLLVLCVFALAIALTFSAYAEVQNVKVSGDITTRALARMGYGDPDTSVTETFTWGDSGTLSATSPQVWNDEHFIMTTARLRVDADLTDNVSLTMVLNSQKDWGRHQSCQARDIASQLDTVQQPILNNLTQTDDNFNVQMEKAFVTLKEFFYQPLTLIIGRQNLWYGRGFIMGYNRSAWDNNNAISADEYSTTGTFDAVRAVLDFNPWTLDLVYSTTNTFCADQTPTAEQQRNILGANVNYKFSEYNAEAEAYYWYSRWNGGSGIQNAGQNHYVGLDYHNESPEERILQIIGGRGEFDPIANLTLFGEVAYQWGKYNPNDESASPLYTLSSIRKRQAWALDLGGEYRFSDYAWQPKVGGEFILYSGDKNPWSTDGKYKGWDMFYRGKFDTAIREFMEVVYPTRDRYDTASSTNQMQFAAEGSIRPIEALEVYGRYTYFRVHRSLSSATTLDPAAAEGQVNVVDTLVKPISGRDKDLGHEVDVKLTYDYTEDVQFSLLGAWFFPGDYYKDASSKWVRDNNTSGDANPELVRNDVDQRSAKTLSEIVGSVKVSF